MNGRDALADGVLIRPWGRLMRSYLRKMKRQKMSRRRRRATITRVTGYLDV